MPVVSGIGDIHRATVQTIVDLSADRECGQEREVEVLEEGEVGREAAREQSLAAAVVVLAQGSQTDIVGDIFITLLGHYGTRLVHGVAVVGIVELTAGRR